MTEEDEEFNRVEREAKQRMEAVSAALDKKAENARALGLNYEMDDCPKCEYNKSRAARWRAEAYRQAGHDVIELPWVGLTDEEIEQGCKESWVTEQAWQSAVWWAEAKLKEKNT